jgi:hypothetical protein
MFIILHNKCDIKYLIHKTFCIFINIFSQERELHELKVLDGEREQGPIFLISISAENISDKFSASNIEKFPPKKTDINSSKHCGEQSRV